jgi:hypothetical protein
MGFTYRNRKHIARAALVLFVFILFLATCFIVWEGAYGEGSREATIISQFVELRQFNLPNDSVNTEKPKHQLDSGLIGLSIICVLLILTCFIEIYRNKLFTQRNRTLVAFCVRMNE